MAPNIKKVNLLASSLQDLDIHVQSKYLPLTHPQEEAQQSIHQEVETRTPVPTGCDSASYWDWPADVPEEPKALFSASALEDNLIKDSQRESSTDIIYAAGADVAENDDYWSERVEEPEVSTTTTKPQHDTYWSWPADPQNARIKAILEDEKVRTLLSAQHIVDNLVNSRSGAPSSSSSQAKPDSDSYWRWDSSTPSSLVVSETLDEVYSQAYWQWTTDDRSKAEINKAELIQSILEAESCRQVVSLAKIEENLKKATIPETSATTQASSDDYWSWAPAAEKVEEEGGYWDWSAKPVTTGKGYWDW